MHTEWLNVCVYRGTEGQTDRRTDGRTDRRTDSLVSCSAICQKHVHCSTRKVDSHTVARLAHQQLVCLVCVHVYVRTGEGDEQQQQQQQQQFAGGIIFQTGLRGTFDKNSGMEVPYIPYIHYMWKYFHRRHFQLDHQNVYYQSRCILSCWYNSYMLESNYKVL